MNKSISLLILLTTLLFISCKKELTTVENFDFVPNKLEFDKLKIKSKMEYKEGQKTSRATLHIRVNKDDMIWMSVQNTIEAFRILIKKDSLFVIDRLGKKFHALSYDDLQKKMGFELNYDFFESLLTANVPDKIQEEGKKLKKDDMTYFLNKDGYYQFEYFVSESLRHLEMIRVTELPSNNSLTVNYDDYVQTEGKSIYPYNIKAKINYKTDIQFTTSDISIQNVDFEVLDKSEDLKFPFNVPDKYVRN